MNGRTARKLLWRARSRDMWGRRAFVSVRIPLSAIPDRPPTFDRSSIGKEIEWQGNFERVEDGKIYRTTIEKVWGGVPPDGAFFVVEDSPGFTWWEGVTVVNDATAYKTFLDEGGALPEVLEERVVDEAVVGGYREWRRWLDKYTHEQSFPDGSPLCRFQEAARFSRTQYGELDSDYFYLTFSVKYYYRSVRDGFCRALSRAMKVCKKAGIDVRVIA